MCCCKHFSGKKLSAKSSNQKGISADGSFSFFVSPKDSCPNFPEQVESLRSETESVDELAAAVSPDAGDASGPHDSGDGVVEDELLSELTDNPGTTRGTNCQSCRSHFYHFR